MMNNMIEYQIIKKTNKLNNEANLSPDAFNSRFYQLVLLLNNSNSLVMFGKRCCSGPGALFIFKSK